MRIVPAVATALLIPLLIAGCTAIPAHSRQTPASRPSAPTTPGASAEPLSPTAATKTVESFLDAVTQASSGSGASPELSTTIGVALLADVQAQLSELHANGWTSTGSPRIASLRIVPGAPEDGTTVVEACIDSSGVRTLDSEGTPLPASPTPRSLTIYTITDDGNGPRVTDRRLPDNPAC